MFNTGSLAINDPKASHRIVGKSEILGNGIFGYYDRSSVGFQLEHLRSRDPKADLRVEPHNAELMGKALRSTDVEWIVNSDGELGVKIGDQFFFMYKGESFMYGTVKTDPKPDKYRLVEKREFGESGPTSPLSDFKDVGTWRPMNHDYANNEVAYLE